MNKLRGIARKAKDAVQGGREPTQPRSDTKWGYATTFAIQSMNSCSKTHCGSQPNACWEPVDTFLPTRVIDVGPSNGSEEPRLLVTAQLRKQEQSQGERPRGRYIALSYCWGEKQNYTTTLASLASMQVRIPWSELPLTIKDAIEVTRKLKVRYLWVDAFCIIQDSPGDWSAEAGKMVGVYGGAFLTISCAAGPDVQHGLSTKDQKKGTLGPIYAPAVVLAEEPLNKRAWALQERLLSPRMLIFGSHDLYWECRNHQFSRSGIHYALVCRRLQLKPAADDWKKIVEEYSCRSMTRETDKLPALAGLAASFEASTGLSLVSGLVRIYLMAELLWFQKDGSRIEPGLPIQYRAPSWSWASIDGEILHPITTYTSYGNGNDGTIDGGHLWTRLVDWFDNPGSVRRRIPGEWICLEGPLVEACLEGGHLLFEEKELWNYIRMDYRSFNEEKRRWEKPENLTTVWCLVFGSSLAWYMHSKRLDSAGICGLILEKYESSVIESDFNVYRRIGCFVHRGWDETVRLFEQSDLAREWEKYIQSIKVSTIYII